MNTEIEVLEEYLLQQQNQINNLTQSVILLQTRNAILEKQLIAIRGYVIEPSINRTRFDKIHGAASRLDPPESTKASIIKGFSLMKNSEIITTEGQLPGHIDDE